MPNVEENIKSIRCRTSIMGLCAENKALLLQPKAKSIHMLRAQDCFPKVKIYIISSTAACFSYP